MHRDGGTESGEAGGYRATNARRPPGDERDATTERRWPDYHCRTGRAHSIVIPLETYVS